MEFKNIIEIASAADIPESIREAVVAGVQAGTIQSEHGLRDIIMTHARG